MDAAVKVLLVEDDAHSAAAMGRLLKMNGYEVFLAQNVRTALLAADAQRFDLALCDIEVPDGDECDLMEQLHAAHELDGIALTGLTMPQEIDRVQKAGFHFLTKPVSFENVKAALGLLLESSRMPSGEIGSVTRQSDHPDLGMMETGEPLDYRGEEDRPSNRESYEAKAK